MVVHFRSKENKRYPRALCNVIALGSIISEDFSECTCKTCIKAYRGKGDERSVNRLFKSRKGIRTKKIENQLTLLEVNNGII